MSETSNAVRRKRGKSSKKSSKRRRELEELEEEQRLACSLFGGSSGALSQQYSAQSRKKQELLATDDFFQIDRIGDAPREEHAAEFFLDDHDDGPEGGTNVESPGKDGGPAWVDRDDVKVNLLHTSRLRKLRSTKAEGASLTGSELEGRLRQRFQRTQQKTVRTDWAAVANTKATEESDEDAFQNSSALLLRQKGRRLPSDRINMKRCPDANLADPNKSVVQAVHFHPASDEERPLLLTGGVDKTLRFFQVAEDSSEKIHGVYFPKLPIYSAQFLGSTGNVVVTGRRPFFYLYNTAASRVDLVPRIVGRQDKSLETCVASPDGRTIALGGNDGYIILFDAHTKSWMCDLKLNGSVRAFTFTGAGDELLASGSDGDVYRWDMRNNRKCIERFTNQDGTITSSLAVASRHLAVGGREWGCQLVLGAASKEQKLFSDE